jgi:hypothetical protein
MARTKAEGGISGLQKAAILLIALGPERSAGIFKHLKEEEIEELTLEIANTRSVTPQVKEEVINEFYEVCLAQQYIAEGGINYAKELLEKALGSDKAMDVIGKLTASLQVKPFEFVRKTDASQLINFFFVFPSSRLQAFQMFDFHIQCSLRRSEFLLCLRLHFFFDIQNVLQGISELCHLSHS